MKLKNIKAAGKGWNPESVVSQPEEAFISDPSHAIEGLSKEESDAQLKGVYAKCKEAVEAAKKPEPPAPTEPAKTKGKGEGK